MFREYDIDFLEKDPAAELQKQGILIKLRCFFQLIYLVISRLREYELNASGSSKHGPEPERIYFVIIEMACKS